jgi:hypothetical protein
MPTIYVVFKKAVETHVESVVQWFSGPMIHVDIVPGNLPLSFTSYMFETFSVNPMTGYHPDKHTCLGIEVTQAEHDEAHNMLTRFVQKGFQYNYNDVIRSILPGPVLASDVKSEDEISTLYCSQAVTLVLRMCLIENKELIAALGGLNSRFTTPNMLYEVLKNHASETTALHDVRVP